ncbi:MAG: response regulator, partial [Bacteroidia bacterium]|nr:response regulator [Bacteroidia bacterium]
NLKVFITDDDVFSLNIYEQYLLNMGFNDIHLFQSGVDCLNSLHQNPDIILLDYNMDVMNGFEVIEKVKRYNPNIFIVMISGQENINTAIQVLKYGAFDYIIKGEDVEYKIKNVIQRILLIQEEIKKNNSGIIKKLFSYL